MSEPISINAFRCKVWSLHDRLEGDIDEESCKAEINSFLEHGQLVPVLGRRLRGDPDFDIELIYGARRLFVAQHLNQNLLVDVREMTDREAIIAMDMENRLRKDLSPYERGLSYARWLRSGNFESQDDIVRALGISASQVSRLLRLARLPAVVVDAFRSATDICENWGLDLMDALENPERREATIRSARVLSRQSPRLLGREVYRRLCSYSERGSKPRATGRDKVVTGIDGRPLYRVKYRNDSIALIVPVDKVSHASFEMIEAYVTGILQKMPARAPAIDLGNVTPLIQIEATLEEE